MTCTFSLESFRPDYPMKYRRWLRVVVFSCCAASAMAAQAVDCRALSGKVLDSLDAGNFAAAGSDFDDKMKSLTPEKLQQDWETLASQMGTRGAREVPQLIPGDGMMVVITRVHFGSQIAKAVVACSADGKISGFHIGL